MRSLSAALFDEQSYLEHGRNTEPCLWQPLERIEGFDAGQEACLKSRKKTVTELSEVEKWNAVFRILFPHLHHPVSPLCIRPSPNKADRSFSL